MNGSSAFFLVLALASIIAASTDSVAPAALAPPTAADTSACLDTLHASDSIIMVMTMRVRPQDSTVTLPSGFEGFFVQEFRSRFRIPPSLPLTVMSGWPPCDSAGPHCDSGILWLGSQAYVTAHQTGALSRFSILDPSLTPALADTVRAVLQRMSDEKAVPFIESPDSIPLDVRMGMENRPDTVPTYRHVFRIKIPHYGLAFTRPNMTKNTRGPGYPRNAEMAGIGDSIALTFTILPDGSVAPRSVDINAGHYTDFMKAVFDWISKTRYIPGRIGICPVSTWQAQNFVFKARR